MYFYFSFFISHFLFRNMPYSQFTSIQSVREQLGLRVVYERLFPNLIEMQPTDLLSQVLARVMTSRIAYFSEKSRSEAIVFPILNEIRFLHENHIALYSGANIEGDKEKGLNGECDFVLSAGSQGMEVVKPVFCIVEAKDQDIRMGTPQCMAQLMGAKLFNEKDGITQNLYYGAVTTGTNWTFLKMEDNLVTIDTRDYSFVQLPQLLGVLESIVTFYIDK